MRKPSLVLVLLLLLLISDAGVAQEDARAWYDVQTYRLDLRVDPETSTLSGTVGIAAKVVADKLDRFELDLMQGREVMAVRLVDKPITPDSPLTGPAATFIHEGDKIVCQLR